MNQPGPNPQLNLALSIVAPVIAVIAAVTFWFTKPVPVTPTAPVAVNVSAAKLPDPGVVYANTLPGGGGTGAAAAGQMGAAFFRLRPLLPPVCPICTAPHLSPAPHDAIRGFIDISVKLSTRPVQSGPPPIQISSARPNEVSESVQPGFGITSTGFQSRPHTKPSSAKP